MTAIAFTRRARKKELAIRDDFAGTRLEMKKVRREIEQIRREMEQLRSETNSKIDQARSDLIRWQMGISIGLGTAMLTGFGILGAVMAKGFGWLGF